MTHYRLCARLDPLNGACSRFAGQDQRRVIEIELIAILPHWRFSSRPMFGEMPRSLRHGGFGPDEIGAVC